MRETSFWSRAHIASITAVCCFVVACNFSEPTDVALEVADFSVAVADHSHDDLAWILTGDGSVTMDPQSLEAAVNLETKDPKFQAELQVLQAEHATSLREYREAMAHPPSIDKVGGADKYLQIRKASTWLKKYKALVLNSDWYHKWFLATQGRPHDVKVPLSFAVPASLALLNTNLSHAGASLKQSYDECVKKLLSGTLALNGEIADRLRSADKPFLQKYDDLVTSMPEAKKKYQETEKMLNTKAKTVGTSCKSDPAVVTGKETTVVCEKKLTADVQEALKLLKAKDEWFLAYSALIQKSAWYLKYEAETAKGMKRCGTKAAEEHAKTHYKEQLAAKKKGADKKVEKAETKREEKVDEQVKKAIEKEKKEEKEEKEVEKKNREEEKEEKKVTHAIKKEVEAMPQGPAKEDAKRRLAEREEKDTARKKKEEKREEKTKEAEREEKNEHAKEKEEETEKNLKKEAEKKKEEKKRKKEEEKKKEEKFKATQKEEQKKEKRDLEDVKQKEKEKARAKAKAAEKEKEEESETKEEKKMDKPRSAAVASELKKARKALNEAHGDKEDDIAHDAISNALNRTTPDPSAAGRIARAMHTLDAAKKWADKSLERHNLALTPAEGWVDGEVAAANSYRHSVEQVATDMAAVVLETAQKVQVDQEREDRAATQKHALRKPIKLAKEAAEDAEKSVTHARDALAATTGTRARILARHELEDARGAVHDANTILKAEVQRRSTTLANKVRQDDKKLVGETELHYQALHAQSRAQAVLTLVMRALRYARKAHAAHLKAQMERAKEKAMEKGRKRVAKERAEKSREKSRADDKKLRRDHAARLAAEALEAGLRARMLMDKAAKAGRIASSKMAELVEVKAALYKATHPGKSVAAGVVTEAAAAMLAIQASETEHAAASARASAHSLSDEITFEATPEEAGVAVGQEASVMPSDLDLEHWEGEGKMWKAYYKKLYADKWEKIKGEQRAINHAVSATLKRQKGADTKAGRLAVAQQVEAAEQDSFRERLSIILG